MLSLFRGLLLILYALPAWAELGAWPPQTQPAEQAVLLDTRPLALCTAHTVAGARCLPAGEFSDAEGRLPPWREILWLFSTARLTGKEAVLVLGDQASARQLVAGLLHVAGQQDVNIVASPVDALLDAGWPAGRGEARDFARQLAYTAPMRDELLLFPHEYDPRRHWLAGGSLAATPAGRLAVVTGNAPAQAVARWASARIGHHADALLLTGRTGSSSSAAATFLLAAIAAGMAGYIAARRSR